MNIFVGRKGLCSFNAEFNLLCSAGTSVLACSPEQMLEGRLVMAPAEAVESILETQHYYKPNSPQED